MQVPMSSYLVEIKPQIQELIRLLEREFDYVSVLCTDVKGTTYRVSMHQTTVSDYHFCERGFVVRAWQDGSYTEYSFNNLTDAAYSPGPFPALPSWRTNFPSRVN